MLQLWCDWNIFIRSIGGCVSAFIFSLYWTGFLIQHFTWLQKKTVVRESVPIRHLKKNGTPTLGGIAIFLAYTMSMFIWGNVKDATLWLIFFVWVGFGGIGLLDDYYKLGNQVTSRGLSARIKYGLQSVISLLFAFIGFTISSSFAYDSMTVTELLLSMGTIWWRHFIMVGSSNAFNLTDGLDGLAISQVIIITCSFLIVSSQPSTFVISNTGEITVLCSLLIGSSLGFLWYNCYPAKIFMGDVGALPLGAVLGMLSIVLRQEIFFAIIAIIPVLETISVIMQVLSFKILKKRIFLMAPLHHHLELSGKSESVIVVQFGILSIMIAILCLSVLAYK